MSDLYRDLILEHWKHPHNFGAIENPTVDAHENNPLCGDDVRLQLKIENGKILEAKFSGQGCALSQAASSILTDLLKDESLESAKKMTEKDLLDAIGIHPNPARLKCVLLPFSAFQKGVSGS